MILTEEQRFAIEMAIGLYDDEIRYLIEGKYSDCQIKGFEKYRAVLQAMINGSGTVEPTGGFDLEKARAVDIDLLAATDWGELRRHYSASLAEIERLWEVIKTHNTREESALAEILMKNEFLVRQNAQIEELEAENKRVLLELQKSKNRNMCEERVKKDLQQAARIKELEDTLRDAIQPGDADKIDTFLRDCMCPDSEGPTACCMCPEDTIEFCNLLKRVQVASQQLQAEGKIGPDADAKPHCWQITEERKAAIRDAEIALRDAVLDSNDPHCWDAETAVLRGMLEEIQ